MKKSYSKKIILFAMLFILTSSAFCKNDGKSKSQKTPMHPKLPTLPIELSEKITNIRNDAFSSDGKWYFVNAEKQTSDPKEKVNTLYSLNTKTGEYYKIFENTGTEGINPVYFFTKTQKLYFVIRNGSDIKNDVQTFEGFGIYTVQKDSNEKYSANGLKRYASPPNWIMKKIDKAFMLDSETPDYEGFLNYLYGFADTGTNPVLQIQTDYEDFVYDEQAVKYLCTSGKIKSFVNETRENNILPLEKYLFVRDENGNPTDKSAFTNNGSKKFRISEEKFTTNSYFAEADGRLYFFSTINSVKNAGTKNEYWSNDSSIIFEVFDEGVAGNDFYFNEPAGLLHFRAVPFVENVLLPIEVDNDRLVLNDVDGESKWIYENDKLVKFYEVKNIQSEQQSLFANPFFVICVLLTACLIVVSILFLAFLSGQMTAKWQRKFAYKIEENEKRKIAKDIHDTIVQDIRAIRIDTEMLAVQDESKHKQNELVEKITQCVVKMRNICYGLSPAELSLQNPNTDSTNEKVDLLSICDALCSQFVTRTNIPCHMSTDSKDGEIKSIMLPKETAENIVRIIQEAFRNIEKHSYANEAKVLIRKDDSALTFFIIDDGIGCDLKNMMNGKNSRNHFGLRMMKERVSLIGGEIVFRSEPNDGMQVKLNMKYEV